MEEPNIGIAAAKNALVTRLSFVVLLPFIVTVILAVMFFVLTARIKDVDVGIRLVNIERQLQQNKNYPLAIEQYERIARSNKSALIYARLGRLYYYLSPKDSVTAIKYLELAKKTDPSFPETYSFLTYIFSELDQPDDAIREGKKALELSNNLDSTTYNNLAWLYATSKRPGVTNLRLAEVYAEKAVKLTNEKHAPSLDTLAEVYYRMGGTSNRNLALIYLRKAYMMAPREELQSYRNHFKQLFPKEGLLSLEKENEE